MKRPKLHKCPECGRQHTGFTRKCSECMETERIHNSAGAQLRNAVKKGLVQRGSCGVCGVDNADGHHDDYNNPLDVRWLCRKHHAAVHPGGFRDKDNAARQKAYRDMRHA